MTTEALAKGLQVTESNAMLGVESRAKLLRGLGKSLLTHPDIFGKAGRPGNAVGRSMSTSAIEHHCSLLPQITC